MYHRKPPIALPSYPSIMLPKHRQTENGEFLWFNCGTAWWHCSHGCKHWLHCQVYSYSKKRHVYCKVQCYFSVNRSWCAGLFFVEYACWSPNSFQIRLSPSSLLGNLHMMVLWWSSLIDGFQMHRLLGRWIEMWWWWWIARGMKEMDL